MGSVGVVGVAEGRWFGNEPAGCDADAAEGLVVNVTPRETKDPVLCELEV